MCKCKLWLQESRDAVFCVCKITDCYRAQTQGDDDDDDDDDHGGDDENDDDN